jgi:hypothetical protein
VGLRSTFLSQHRKYKFWVNRKYNRSTCEPTWAPLKSYSRAWGLGSLHRRGSLLKHWMVEETFADLYTTCFSYGWRFLVDLKRDCTTWIQSSHTTASHQFYFTAASHHFHKSLKTRRFYFTAASHHFHFTAAFPVFKDLWKWWEFKNWKILFYCSFPPLSFYCSFSSFQRFMKVTRSCSKMEVMRSCSMWTLNSCCAVSF